jgi:hypothetical protein
MPQHVHDRTKHWFDSTSALFCWCAVDDVISRACTQLLLQQGTSDRGQQLCMHAALQHLLLI